MQILGILSPAGVVLDRVTVTMFRSEADEAEIVKRVTHMEGSHKKRGKVQPFNKTRAAWDVEFDLHKARLSTEGAEGARVFPLEQRETANNYGVVARMKAYEIGL